MDAFSTNDIQFDFSYDYEPPALVNTQPDPSDALQSVGQIRVNDGLHPPGTTESADYKFSGNYLNDWVNHTSANQPLAQVKISNHSLLGFNSGYSTAGLRPISDPCHQLLHSSNEHFLTSSWPFPLNIHADNMDPNIDTSLDASIDSVMAMDLVSSENKTPAPDSETMSDSTTQGTPSAISSTTIDLQSSRRRNRGGQNLTCNEPPCTNVPFSDQTCLSRHVREKHGSEMYYCPISTCKRYRKGFPRRFNLLAHKRRCHPEQASSLNELLKDSPREGTSGSRGDNRLWAKLNELKELRHEIDEEIGTLEDASRIMSDYEE